MNWSIYTASPTTHFKIVAVGLLAGLLVSFIGITAAELNRGAEITTTQRSSVATTRTPVAFSDRNGFIVR
jgi:hypothetical protein